MALVNKQTRAASSPAKSRQSKRADSCITPVSLRHW